LIKRDKPGKTANPKDDTHSLKCHSRSRRRGVEESVPHKKVKPP
jgi:hypothetical protein